MYAEEYLPDDAVFEYENDVSIDETSSMDTNERDIKKRHEVYKRSDPDFYSFKTTRYNEEGEPIQQKTEIYSSPTKGFIRHASSGAYEPHKVGSKYESLYFCVKDVSTHTKPDTISKDPRKLFYRNPEEFERHHSVTLSREIKKDWHERYDIVRRSNMR